ncbi:T9SS type A sorting domain-containing protein [Flavobacterium longum]
MFAPLNFLSNGFSLNRMKLLPTAILCLALALGHAQPKKPDHVPADNGTELNPDGTNKFENPIGLDLLGGNTKGITIYPNPTDDFVMISVAGKASEKREILMTTLTGKEVCHLADRRENTFFVDTSGLRKGIYVIKVMSGNKVYTKKWARR